MREPHDHSRLLERYVCRADLVCETAVHIGTGKTSADVRAASDMPVARDASGRPYIPGSSFRGALRAALESLLRGLDYEEDGHGVCDPLTKETSCAGRIQSVKESSQGEGPLGEEAIFRLAWEGSCPICRLFGNTFLASRLWIGDLALKSGADVYNRDGVGLDRDLRTAAPGILYDFEAVPAGASFELRLDLENPAPFELGLVFTGLDLFAQGFASVGGKRARGLGGASIRSVMLRRFVAADYFAANQEGTEVAAEEVDGFRNQARSRYVTTEDG